MKPLAGLPAVNNGRENLGFAAAEARARNRGGVGSSKDGRVGLTLRLHPEVWRTVHVLAAENTLTLSDILKHGINYMLRESGRPELPIEDMGRSPMDLTRNRLVLETQPAADAAEDAGARLPNLDRLR